MRHAHNTTLDPQAILRASMPFKKAIGVTAVRTEAEYAAARSVVDALTDVIGDDESHPIPLPRCSIISPIKWSHTRTNTRSSLRHPPPRRCAS